MVSGNSRITLDNTLDERLRLLEDRVRLGSCFHVVSRLTVRMRTDATGDQEQPVWPEPEPQVLHISMSMPSDYTPAQVADNATRTQHVHIHSLVSPFSIHHLRRRLVSHTAC